MLYTIRWLAAKGLRSESRFATWNGLVTDTSPVISWLTGRRIESAIEILETRYGGKVTLVDGSWHVNRVPDAWVRS